MQKSLFFLLILGMLAGGATYIYGNKTKKTYYPNGVVQSVAPQSFFKTSGTYKEFYEDGTVKLTVPYIDGLKNGKQKEYLKDGTRIETIYKDNLKSGIETYLNSSGETLRVYTYSGGQKSGIAKIMNQDKVITLSYLSGKLQGAFNYNNKINGFMKPNGEFEIKNAENEVPAYVIQGKNICSDDKLTDGLSAYLTEQNPKTTQALFGCLSIMNTTVTDNQNTITFEGNLTYPLFKKDSKLTIDVKKTSPINVSAPLPISPQSGKMIITFKENNQDTQIRVLDDDYKDVLFLAFQSKSPISEGIFQLVNLMTNELVGTNEEQNSLFKDTTLTKYELFGKDKKAIMSFTGGFNLLSGLTPDSKFEVFNPVNQKPLIQWISTNNGLNFNLFYPKSNVPFISSNIQVTDSFKNAYQKIMQLAATLDEIKMMDELQMTAPILLSGISLEDFSVYQNNQEKVLSASLKWKKDISIFNIIQSPADSVVFRTTFFENGKELFSMENTNDEVTVSEGGILSKITPEEAHVKVNALTQSYKADVFEVFANELEDMFSKGAPDSLLTDEYIKKMDDYRANEVAQITKQYAQILLEAKKKNVIAIESPLKKTETILAGETHKQVIQSTVTDTVETSTSETINTSVKTAEEVDKSILPSLKESGVIGENETIFGTQITPIIQATNHFDINDNLMIKLTFDSFAVCVKTAQKLGVSEICKPETKSFIYVVKP
ncbi:MAG: hypothetical protein IKZ02_05650 [Alphaproteobacteria bacterium]|nr:hypothetical protein [Alphaproteobacteria bacterium]